MYYNICVYVNVYIYIYHPNPQGHKSVASQSLNLHLGTSAHEFRSQCLVKTFIFRFNYCIKVVLFYPLCHNIIFTSFYHPACLQFRSRSTTSLPLPAVAACCSTAPAHRPRRPNSESRRLRRWLSRPSGWRPSSSLAWEIGSVVNQNISLSIINND